jgi:hypothetical protein
MEQQHPNRPLLPVIRDLERQFEAKYHRKMTPEEKRWFHLVEELLMHVPEETGESN